VTDLSGRSICVVGATGGLGAPVSRRLADAGARLTLVGRDRGRLDGLVRGAAVVVTDLRDPGSADAAVAGAVAANGGVDGVVFAAGVVAFGSVADLTDETLTELFLVNTLAPVRLLRAALPWLTQSAEAGRSPFVVHVSAVVAEQPVAGMAAYSASKAALTAFDHAAARELRRSGVRLLEVRPPHSETGLAQRPIAGVAPALPRGLDPDRVAVRVVSAIVDGQRDLPSTAFG
jgi:NAD(P)-dependent dehydrogenase (short-subunit alcohol dehydrogenase family)